MSVFDKKYLEQARKEGRVCAQCGWMVNKARWKKGKRLCAACEDANRGMGKLGGRYAASDEPRELTGNN